MSSVNKQWAWACKERGDLKVVCPHANPNTSSLLAVVPTAALLSPGEHCWWVVSWGCQGRGSVMPVCEQQRMVDSCGRQSAGVCRVRIPGNSWAQQRAKAPYSGGRCWLEVADKQTCPEGRDPSLGHVGRLLYLLGCALFQAGKRR